ncbi:MAG TPA: amidohydrolase [Sediminibacterium sp.]|nr:amidohydrolase [Sediminibacterium sp.]
MSNNFRFGLLSCWMVLIVQTNIWAQPKQNIPTAHQSIQAATDQIAEKLVQIRRTLHQHPELAGKEQQTQAFLKQHLLQLGLEVKTPANGYGIIGILKGAKPGKKIAWRADMDALPNDFPDPVDFKSTQPGVQHGCGHDIHMAIALGMAEVLSKNKALFNGTVYFIFQPEEETFVGAKKMLDNLVAQMSIAEIYGLHITAIPAGQIMVKANEIFAYQKRVKLSFKNELTPEAIQEINTILSTGLSRSLPNSKPWEMQYTVDPKIGLSNANTIFKDYCIINQPFSNYIEQNERILATDLYETNAANLVKIIPTIKQLIGQSKHASKLLSVSFIQENPTIQNNPSLTKFAISSIDEIYGKGFVVADYGQVPFFNDDFAYYQEKIPGVYFLYGGSNFEKGIIAMNHAPNFMVDESCISTGVKCFSSLLFERAKH